MKIELTINSQFENFFRFDLITGVFIEVQYCLKSNFGDASNKTAGIGSTNIVPTDYFNVNQNILESNFDDTIFDLKFTPKTLDVQDGTGGYDGSWSLIDKTIKGTFYDKKNASIVNEILAKDNALYTTTAPIYPILKGDALSFDGDKWVYSAYSQETEALVVSDLKKSLTEQVSHLIQNATTDKASIDIFFYKTDKLAYKMPTTIEALDAIFRECEKRDENKINFSSIDGNMFFSIAENDLTKRQELIEFVLSKVNEFKRVRAEIKATALAKIDATQTINELEKFVIDIGDFDNDGQDKGWAFVENKMQLKLQNIDNVEIKVYQFNPQKTYLVDQELQNVLDYFSVNL